MEVRGGAAPLGQQELDVPGRLALVVQELLRHLLAELGLLRTAWRQFVQRRVQRERPVLGLPHLEGDDSEMRVTNNP